MSNPIIDGYPMSQLHPGELFKVHNFLFLLPGDSFPVKF